MRYIISKIIVPKRNVMILIPNNWDDFHYKTSFDAVYFDKEGVFIELGTIKIGKKELEHGWVKDCMKSSFTKLPAGFFSLWQSADSYQKVRELQDRYGENIFEDLKDMAYNLTLLEKYSNQLVVKSSLLRFVSKHMCVNQFHRISIGEAILTAYQFDYIVKQKDELAEDLRMEFSVRPESLPPTNIHAIIGSNSTGKTTLIKNMIKSICNGDTSKGEFAYAKSDEDELGYFESVMCVSFSPFDNYSDVECCENFKYIGVRKEYSADGYEEISLLDDISKKFLESYRNCMVNRTKRNDWLETIKLFDIEEDYIFNINNFTDIANNQNVSLCENMREIEKIFDSLSAGHKAVLSIITRCIDQLAEKTILFVDEPENHLHPPLLSTMIRGISQMLIKRNGVAIISTHSPIVLQEIPSSCVWILNRQNKYMFANRPEIETFGTNIGVLTNEVFGYEVKSSGFNMMLQKCVDKCDTYEEVLEKFNYQLGNEARSMVRILLARKGDE